MTLEIILIMVGVANILIIYTLLIALKNYLSEYKVTLDIASKNQDVAIAKQEILSKLEKLELISTTKKSCFIGVGGGGCNIVSYIKEYDNRHRAIYVNSDLQALAQKKSNNKIHLQKENEDNLGCGGDDACAKQLLNSHSKTLLRKMIKKHKKVFVVASLGGGTGSGVVVDIVTFLQSIGKSVHVGVTLPFDYEGQKRKTTAQNALQELHAKTENVTMFKNNDILKDIQDEGIQDSFNMISEKIYRSLIMAQE